MLLDGLHASFSAPSNGWTAGVLALLLVNGTSTMFVTLPQNNYAFIAYAVLFGFCDGAWTAVNDISEALTCVDQSGVASALGFNLLGGSVTLMVGTPISGGTAKLPHPVRWRVHLAIDLTRMLRS